MAVVFLSLWILYALYLGSPLLTEIHLRITTKLGLYPIQTSIVGTSKADISSIINMIDLASESILSISTRKLREEIIKLPWVSEVYIKRNYPNKININVYESTPYALWKNASGTYVVDKNGSTITDKTSEYEDSLLLLIGKQANKRGIELISFLEETPLNHLILSATLVTNRRWNLMTKDGVIIKLPEIDPIKALTKIAELHTSNKLLDRDILAVDLRVPGKVFIRLSYKAFLDRRSLLLGAETTRPLSSEATAHNGLQSTIANSTELKYSGAHNQADVYSMHKGELA